MFKFTSRKSAVVLTFVFIPLVIFMSIKGVYAANLENISGTSVGQNMAQCNGGNLTGWDWPDQVKTTPHQSGSDWPDTLFDAQKFDYIIYLSQTQAAATTSPNNGFAYAYTLLDSGSGGNFKISTINGETWLSNKGSQGQDLATYMFTLNDSYKPWDTNHFASAISSPPTLGVSGAPESDPTYHKLKLTGTSVACISAMHGVEYDPGYAGPKYKAAQGYTLGGGASCATWDVACKLSGAFQTVTGAIGDFAREVFSWFTGLFMPEGSKIKGYIDDFNAFMVSKLGFLTYPFSFLSNVFNAFTTGATWCTNTSCQKDFGVIFGTHFIMDLNEPQIATPTIWSWFKGVVVGLTILELVITIRRKMMSVVHK